MREVFIAEKVIHMRKVVITDEGQKRLDRCEAECRCPWCLGKLPKPPHTVARGVKAGVHIKCHQKQQRLIGKGATTKNELIKHGKRREDKPGGAPSTSEPADFAEAS